MPKAPKTANGIICEAIYTCNFKKMREVKFYLEKRKDKKSGEVIAINVPILLFYSYGKGRLQFYTGLRVDAKKWDETGMKVKKNFSEAAEINQELNKLRVKVQEVHDRAKVLGERLSPQYFKDHLNGKRKDAKNGDLIWKYYKEYVEAIKVTHTKESIRRSGSSFKVLEWFCKEKNWSLTFASIDAFFWQEFFDWCYNVKGYYNNYTGTHINKIKAFLNWAVQKGYTTNLEFRKQRKMYENTEIIYLSFEEVEYFLNYPFQNEIHKQVRDMYCLGCFTGLRYSDISRLLPENIQGDKIVYRVVKTKQANIVPLNKYSKTILERNIRVHPTNAMPYIGPLVVNKLLKEAMKEAKMERPVQVIHFRGAERYEESKPLWDAATFHTSKKTFVTNFLERGGSLLTAMAITGNRSFSVMKRYYKIADKFKAQEMRRIFGGT
jgi:integrase